VQQRNKQSRAKQSQAAAATTTTKNILGSKCEATPQT